MSYNWNTRTELLLGADRMERLAHSHVLVVGLGGVGAYAAEQICRAGIGHMTIVDADTVNESNINRQLPALHSTLGMPKAEVVARRLLDINPRLKLGVLNEFLRDERTEEVLSATPVRFCRRRDRFPQSESIPLVSRLSEKYPCCFLNGCRSQDGPVTSQDRGYLEDLQLRIGKSRTQTTARSGRQQRDSGLSSLPR